MNNNDTSPVFDYRALRLLVGVIAITIGPVVTIISSMPISSISASYHQEARDVFVGMLFVVSALLWAYNVHTIRESIASKGASIAGILVALFPTYCPTCSSDPTSKIHFVAAVTLFAILAYFCFGPFRKNTRNQKGKKRLRSGIYIACGVLMVGCLVVGSIVWFALTEDTLAANGIIYWVETIALSAFGFAWIVAGKYFRIFVDEEQRLRLLGR